MVTLARWGEGCSHPPPPAQAVRPTVHFYPELKLYHDSHLRNLETRHISAPCPMSLRWHVTGKSMSCWTLECGWWRHLGCFLPSSSSDQDQWPAPSSDRDIAHCQPDTDTAAQHRVYYTVYMVRTSHCGYAQSFACIFISSCYLFVYI